MRIREILTIALCVLFTVSCKQQGYHIHLEKDSGLVYCYADSQRVVFNNDYMDGGALVMMAHVTDRYVYVVGDLKPNSYDKTERYHLYRIDKQTLETKHIGNFAAIHFEESGFKAATTRLTNPDAKCTADEMFSIQDNYYNYDGELIRKGENEYPYEDMIREYGDTLVNANGYR